jgi:hypothetical protein
VSGVVCQGDERPELEHYEESRGLCAAGILFFAFLDFHHYSLLSSVQAHHLHPADLSLLYNIAMIQQKSAEMLFALPPQKRTLKELKEAIDGAGAGQQYVVSTSRGRNNLNFREPDSLHHCQQIQHPRCPTAGTLQTNERNMVTTC